MTEPANIHVLLIEDDQRLAALTREYLQRQGVVVSHEADGRRGLDQALRHRFDCILLDLMLPGLDGIQVCQKIRARSDVPILMLTARGEEADRVMGLELGADDYIPKPYSPRELLARVRSAVRRARGQAGPASRPLAVGDLELDPGARQARLAGALVDLTAYEFSLLQALVERAGRVLSREQLMDLAGGDPAEAFDRSVDVHISRIRAKLGDDPRRPERIKTVRGVGYLFMDPEGP